MRRSGFHHEHIQVVDFCSYSPVRRSFYPSKSTQNLDPSYKTDLDFKIVSKEETLSKITRITTHN